MVKNVANIVERIEENAKRMKIVREKAEALREIAQLGEPETPTQTVNIAPRQPLARREV